MLRLFHSEANITLIRWHGRLLWGIRPMEAFTVFNVLSRAFAVLVIPFSALSFTLTYPTYSEYSILCHRYLCKRDSIDCTSLASFASQFSISGSDLRRTCSTLLCWCSASHARCPAIEANSSIKCDYDPSLSSLFSLPLLLPICHQLHQCQRFHNSNPRLLVSAQGILTLR